MLSDSASEIIAFTVGGMHPPVPVASAYEAVVSAQIEKATATVATRKPFAIKSCPRRKLPPSRAKTRRARREPRLLPWRLDRPGAFRTLESQYRADPQEYSLPPAAGDSREGSSAAQVHGRGFPLFAGRG